MKLIFLVGVMEAYNFYTVREVVRFYYKKPNVGIA
jgi:hypothetical protein